MSEQVEPIPEGYPVVRCPSCHFEILDPEGFGFYFCERCRYCVHPSGEGVSDGRLRCLTCGVIYET